MSANVGDLVTAENVSGLAIGTWVEWTSTHYGRVSATKTAIDTWVATRQGQTFHFRDTDMAGGVPAYIAATPDPTVTIPAAELARLREQVRVLLDALDEHEDASEEADRIDYHEDHVEAVYAAKAALRADLTATADR